MQTTSNRVGQPVLLSSLALVPLLVGGLALGWVPTSAVALGLVAVSGTALGIGLRGPQSAQASVVA